ncbi:MAG: prepilin peptidase [Candidatus Omnitrophota bacterium]
MIEKIAVFILGGCIGSFLNVCIHRLPKDMSIVRPASFCPKCKAAVKWFDNIPLLSYFILSGKCRQCKGGISLRYPSVEFITACLFLFLYINFSLTADFFKFAVFFSLLIVVSFIDIDYHAIPAYLCFIGIVAGLMFSLYDTAEVMAQGFSGRMPVFKAVKDLFISLGFAYFFKFSGDIFLAIYLALRKKDSIEGEKEALGLGDVDFMGVVGVFLGWPMAVLTFFIAPFIAIVYSIYAMLFKKTHLIPYLPYLSAAALVSFLWGKNILAYLGLI